VKEPVNDLGSTVLFATATVTASAPELVRVMLPPLAPAVALAASRRYTVVEATVPAVPTVTVGEKVTLSVDASNPVGGVTRMPAPRFSPETVKEVEADAVP